MNRMDAAAARILDANFNRAREALRALEDVARFALDAAELTESLKRARHALAAVAAALPAGELLAAREVAGDVGATIETPCEYVRDDRDSLVRANSARATEALRSIEEQLKCVGRADLARQVEQLRYDVYRYEPELIAGGPRCQRVRTARLHVLITESLCARPWTAVAEALIAARCDLIQLREKSLPDREWLARARWLVAAARGSATAIVLNDRPDLARLAEADGVHVGQDDLAVADARRIGGAGRAVGRSTHSAAQVRVALDEKADYIAVGPMHESTTKPGREPAGVALLRDAAATVEQWCRETGRAAPPLVAIGGITPQRVEELLAAGASAVAVSQAVIAATDPAAACAEFIARLDAIRAAR